MILGPAVLLLHLATQSPAPAPLTGYGPWRLGMSREQVKAVAAGAPYTPVSTTGGFETKTGAFAGKKTTVSFVFGEKGLRIIQIWAYEGNDTAEAAAAFHRVYQHLEKTRGAVDVTDLSLPPHADAETFTRLVLSALAAIPPGDPAKLQISPKAKDPHVVIFSSLIRHPQLGYYVFLYYRQPDRHPPQ